jgi:hypothetical protein
VDSCTDRNAIQNFLSVCLSTELRASQTRCDIKNTKKKKKKKKWDSKFRPVLRMGLEKSDATISVQTEAVEEQIEEDEQDQPQGVQVHA